MPTDPWAVVSQTPVSQAPASQTPDSGAPPDDGWGVVSQTPDEKSVGGFLGNVAQSGWNLGKNLVSTVHGGFEAPVRWTANKFLSPENQIPPTEEEQQFSNIGDTVAGLAHQGFKKVGLGSAVDETPEAQADIAKAQALETQYKQRLLHPWETFYSDPVGALADVAGVTGGVAGVAGKTAELADAANMGRTASALRTGARVAKVATEKNPVVLVPVKTVAGVQKLGVNAATGLANSALGTTAKTRQFGTNPGMAVLRETTGIRPATVAESARQRIGRITPVMETMVGQGNPASLAPARARIAAGKRLAVIQNDPVLARELNQMEETLTGNFHTGEVYPENVPASTALNLRRGFGNQHVRWVEGRTDVGNEIAKGVYGDLTGAVHEAAPGTTILDDRVHNLIPARDLAVRANLTASPWETAANRATRPTGGLIPAIAGYFRGGLPEAATVMAGQEALAQPTVRMGLARGIYRGVGGPRLEAPAMPMRQIAAPPDTSGFFAPWVANLRNIGQEGSQFAPRTRLLPAATSPFGVSGTVVPDILDASPRGMGTPRPLLEAAPGAPTGGVTQPTRFGRPNYSGQPGRHPQQSTASGPGAKTVGPPTAIPLPPAGTFKNPYR